ncbi:DUF3857 domain-containing protein [Winogradskyella sp. SM1960]|uniref:DUF3857 domain-containing protein n=1 Tax=Winogradskyella sp. SM1960 TaxID=2865955 RepID=UPI001CD7514A|nr:DUF3857 domain-containing protein [Winogradskyella sp. SM1960]
MHSFLDKKHRLFVVAFLISIFSFSQSEDAYIALLAPQELMTKVNAIVRYDNQKVEINAIDDMVVHTKRIVTIYNKYGDKHANSLEFYSDNSSVKSIEAKIYDGLGEEIKKVRKKDFTDNSAVSGGTLYSDSRVMYYDYTPISYPYTIEYISEVKHNTTAFLPQWRPINGYSLAIQHAEYKIENNSGIPLKIKKENIENNNVVEVSEHHFTITNLPGVHYESYSPSLVTFTPNVKPALTKFNMNGVEGVNTNWQDFGKWVYGELLTGTDVLPQTAIDDVKALTEGVDDKIERAKLVYKYMQDKTRYISVQIGIGGWKPMLADDVNKLGYGDCKGLTNYTKALLEAVDVPSYYTLVFGGRNILDIDDEFSSAQGNHAILCVPNNDENIFLECTSQTSPFGFSAGFTDDRVVLLVKPEGGEIVRTKIYEADDSVQKTNANIVMDAAGGFTADVNIETTGFQYSLHDGIENRTARDQHKHYKSYWDNINNITIDNIDIVNDKDRIVLSENVKLSATNYASKSGGRLIFQPNMFNPVTTIPSRYTDRKLEFKVERSFKDTDEFIIQLPEGLKVEAMTDSKEIKTKFGTYSFKLEALEGNQLKYTRTYILLKGNYSKEDYKAFRSFRRQIVRHDKSKVVLIKA